MVEAYILDTKIYLPIHFDVSRWKDKDELIRDRSDVIKHNGKYLMQVMNLDEYIDKYYTLSGLGRNKVLEVEKDIEKALSADTNLNSKLNDGQYRKVLLYLKAMPYFIRMGGKGDAVKRSLEYILTHIDHISINREAITDIIKYEHGQADGGTKNIAEQALNTAILEYSVRLKSLYNKLNKNKGQICSVTDFESDIQKLAYLKLKVNRLKEITGNEVNKVSFNTYIYNKLLKRLSNLDEFEIDNYGFLSYGDYYIYRRIGEYEVESVKQFDGDDHPYIYTFPGCRVSAIIYDTSISTGPYIVDRYSSPFTKYIEKPFRKICIGNAKIRANSDEELIFNVIATGIKILKEGYMYMGQDLHHTLAEIWTSLPNELKGKKYKRRRKS